MSTAPNCDLSSGATFARCGGTVTLERYLTFRWHAEAHSIGQQRPYLSFGGELVDGGIIACGCLHDEIREHVPEAARFLDLHLADAVTGEPMHAEANGYYWIAGVLGGLGERYHGGNSDSPKRTAEDCLRIFASHVRIPLDEARSLVQRLDQETQNTQRGACVECVDGLDTRGALCRACSGTGREEMRRFVRRRWREEMPSMLPRWRREATECVDWIAANAAPDLREEYAARVAWMREHWSPKARRLRAQSEEVKP